MRKIDVKQSEPEVYSLASQLQIHIALSWTACVVLARDMLTGYRFHPKGVTCEEGPEGVRGVREQEGGSGVDEGVDRRSPWILGSMPDLPVVPSVEDEAEAD